MSHYLPNPCLLGIALTISTHNGPQLVYHYPPRPKVYDHKATPFSRDHELIESEDDSSDGSDYHSDEESDSSDENDESRGLDHRHHGNKPVNFVSGQTLLDILDEQDQKRRARDKRREKRRFHAKKNSTTSNGSGGGGFQMRNNSVDTSVLMENYGLSSESRKVFGFDPEFLCEIVTPSRQLCNSRFEFTVDDTCFSGLPIHVNEDGLWRSNRQKRDVKSKHSTNASNTGSMKSRRNDADHGEKEQDEKQTDEQATAEEGEKDNGSETNENTMSMFHVVFVMNPPVVEYEYRVDEMFHYVISRLSLVLRYEQAKSNFVWNEAQKILKIKENNEHLSINQLYGKLIEQSSLAKALAHCYNSISTSEIANLEINDKFISLQIPLKNTFRSLLPKTTPVLPGSYLSSTLNFIDTDDDGFADNNNYNNEYADDESMGFMALLLLDDPEKIITDLRAELSLPLSKFIRSISPMMSLSKLSANSQLDLSQVISFSKHLIYWRRARCIIPLHTKSVFIVSPMAPMQQIDTNIKLFKQEFPSLPSLATFLSLLSNSKPRQYAAIIPSKDHKEIYLDALAWLIRYGYVTQLLTFVWLKISNSIKIQVEEEMEKEGLIKSKGPAHKFQDIAVDNTGKTNGNKCKEKAKSYINGREVNIEENEEEEDIILLDPERATALERRWISKVFKNLNNTAPELLPLFQKVIKYFNGNYPIELVIFKESLSRHELKKLLYCISNNITSVKHW